MWSVWAETVDVYLCRGIVWCRVPGLDAVSLRLPAVLPLAGQLQRVSELLAPHLGKRVVFRIALGARLCPPVCCEVPQSLRWSEQQWLAQKAAAQVWGLNPAEVDQLVCVPSASNVGLAAALPRTTLDVIHRWAGSNHQAKVNSIVPLWANMSGQIRLNRDSKNAFLLVEPDGARTLLHGTQNGCSTSFVDANPIEITGLPHSVFNWNDALAAAGSKSKRSWSWSQCFERRTA